MFSKATGTKSTHKINCIFSKLQNNSSKKIEILRYKYNKMSTEIKKDLINGDTNCVYQLEDLYNKDVNSL